MCHALILFSYNCQGLKIKLAVFPLVLDMGFCHIIPAVILKARRKVTLLFCCLPFCIYGSVFKKFLHKMLRHCPVQDTLWWNMSNIVMQRGPSLELEQLRTRCEKSTLVFQFWVVKIQYANFSAVRLNLCCFWTGCIIIEYLKLEGTHKDHKSINHKECIL